MADDPVELIEVTIERVIAFRESAAAAVVLAHPTKRFLIFVGPSEGAAVQRELAGQRADRPATHDLIEYILKGFDITVVRVVISSIVNNVFCATIILSRSAEAGGPSQELRLDARASDSIVIALKAGLPLLVTRRVIEAVEDATEQLALLEAKPPSEEPGDDEPKFHFDPEGSEPGEGYDPDEGEEPEEGEE